MQVLLVALISPWKGTQSIVFTYLNQLPVTVVQRVESGLLQLEADYEIMSLSGADEDTSSVLDGFPRLGTAFCSSTLTSDSLTSITGSF